MLYEEGELVKYILLLLLKISPYLNCVALDHLYVLQETMERYDARSSGWTFSILNGSVLSVFLHHIWSWYAALYSGDKHGNILMTYHNALVCYYVSWQFYIIKSEDCYVNNES